MLELVLLDFGRAIGAHDSNTGRVWRLKTDMTTSSEERAHQIEAMKLPALKVGDKVRLSAGGKRVMTVIGFEDYTNMAVCEWFDRDDLVNHETFPARVLVRVEE